MTVPSGSAVDTVRAFLAAPGAGDCGRLGGFLAEDAEYRGTGSQRPVVGDRGIVRLLGMLYPRDRHHRRDGRGRARGEFVVSERRERLRTGEVLSVRAMTTVAHGRITSWTDIDPHPPVRLGRLVKPPGPCDTRGHEWQPTSTPS